MRRKNNINSRLRRFTTSDALGLGEMFSDISRALRSAFKFFRIDVNVHSHFEDRLRISWVLGLTVLTIGFTEIIGFLPRLQQN